jgi:hypothetical protein
MTAWTSDELSRIGNAEELQVMSVRPDGTLRKAVTIWVARNDDSLYARSVKGRDSAWFRGVQETLQGIIRAGGIKKDVTFVDVDHHIDDKLNDAYRAKYARYAGRILDSVLTPEARSATVKLVPRGKPS